MAESANPTKDDMELELDLGQEEGGGEANVDQVAVTNAAPPANAIEGGREVNRRVLYVGGIDQNVTEDILSDLFKVAGQVVSIKILPDKNVSEIIIGFVINY